MSQEISVKVLIADREYPLKMEANEVDQVKEAEEEIQQKIKALKANYQVKEKQDLLAMCLLQLLVEKNLMLKGETANSDDFYSKIEDLESFVSGYLKSDSK